MAEMSTSNKGMSTVAIRLHLHPDAGKEASTRGRQHDKTQSAGASMAASATPKSNIFPFLKLPGEVRNMIYRFTFRMPTRISLDTTKRTRRGKELYIVHRMVRYPNEPLPSGQLLRVNSQVYQEGLPVLLDVNRFTIDGFRNLRIVLEAIKPIGRSFIRDIRVYWGQDTRKHKEEAMKKTFSLLCECTNLQYLYICLPALQSPAAVRRLTLADSKDIVKPLPGLVRLTLLYTCPPDVGNSTDLGELNFVCERMVGPDGEFNLQHIEKSF